MGHEKFLEQFEEYSMLCMERGTRNLGQELHEDPHLVSACCMALEPPLASVLSAGQPDTLSGFKSSLVSSSEKLKFSKELSRLILVLVRLTEPSLEKSEFCKKAVKKTQLNFEKNGTLTQSSQVLVKHSTELFVSKEVAVPTPSSN